MAQDKWKRRASGLVDLMEASAWAEDPQHTYQRMVDAVARLFDCSQVHLHLMSGDGEGLRRCAFSNAGNISAAPETADSYESHIKVGLGRVRELIRFRRPVVVDYLNPKEGEWVPQGVVDQGMLWSVSLPVCVDRAVYGICSVVFSTSLEWDAEDDDFAMLVGRAMGAAVARIRATKEEVDIKVIEDRRNLNFRFSDDMAQMIGNMSLAADSVTMLGEGGEYAAMMEGVERLGRISKDAMRLLREGSLHWDSPLYVTDSLAGDLAACLDRLKAIWDFESKMVIDVDGKMPAVSMQVASQVVRICREVLGAMLSIAFESGREAKIVMTLRVDCGFLTVMVEEVAGALGSRDALAGLAGMGVMRERAEAVGGRLSVLSDETTSALCIDVPVASLTR